MKIVGWSIEIERRKEIDVLKFLIFTYLILINGVMVLAVLDILSSTTAIVTMIIIAVSIILVIEYLNRKNKLQDIK
ncbi:hypothetical protein [Thalassobacillus hwangdonensis]|uniref:Uncharacterized protein n=1 Tax=Thalassobacillus hwangdonensis TaxID=546108 RepID=A0ABW3L1N8_9BACI